MEIFVREGEFDAESLEYTSVRIGKLRDRMGTSLGNTVDFMGECYDDLA